MTEQLVLPLVLVETATALPTSDNDWTPQPYLRMESVDDGAGTQAGSAVISQTYGLIRPEYRVAYENHGPLPDLGKTGSGDFAGLLLRLLVQDAAGTITRGSGIYRTTYKARWWGQFLGTAVNPDGAEAPETGGEASWLCAGIVSLLDQIRIRRGWVRSQSGSLVADPGWCPVFNDLPGGDRSSSTFTVNGVSVHVHDLLAASSGNTWTAKQVIDLLLAGLATATGGITWSLSDPTNALAYIVPRLDLRGLKLSDALLRLISPARGLVHWCTVSGKTVTIHVRSTVSEDLVMTGYTLPASTQTTTLDQAAGPFQRHVSVRERNEEVADLIELRGKQPWVGITLAYGTAFGKGWDAGLESSWGGNPGSSVYAHVWRRFLITDTWNGAQYNNANIGLRDDLTVETSAAYGADGFTGARAYDANTVRPPATMLEFTADLPVSEGFSTLRLGPRQKAVVVVGSGSNWVDFSQRWSVTVQQSPAAIIIDDGANGAEIADLVGAGLTLLVTLGVREHQPLRVSWNRATGQRPRVQPRDWSDDLDAEQWIALNGCVTGVALNGTLSTLSSEVSARDDLTRLRAQLALERATREAADVEITWEREGIDLEDARRPGTLLTSLDRGDRTTQPDTLIVGRQVSKVRRANGTASYVTRYRATHVLPGEALLL